MNADNLTSEHLVSTNRNVVREWYGYVHGDI